MIRRPFAFLVAGLLCMTFSVRAQADEAVPLKDFFRNPIAASPVMSPDCQHIALALAGGPDGRRRLVVLNSADVSNSKQLASFADADVQSIAWVNDDRLVFTLTDAQSDYAGQTGDGLYAVDREGKAPPRRLIKRRWANFDAPPTRRELEGSFRLFSVLRDGSNDVIVEDLVLDGRNRLDSTSLWRLDTVTAGTRLLTAAAPARAYGWALGPDALPRVAVSRVDGKTRLHWKPTPDAPWTLFREFDTIVAALPFRALNVDRGGVLYAVAPVSGKTDTTSLVRLDMTAPNEPARALVTLEGHDFTGGLVRAANGDLLGVHHVAEERGTHWFDPGLRTIQAQVDRLLPETGNLIDCGNCERPRIVLVTASSDRQPDAFLLLDVAAGTLKPLVGARPWIKPATMAEREFLRFAARDGLSIPVHVTRPIGLTGPAPMVVLVHGGPWGRARGWAWDSESQFLVSRGYVVVEPEFRSSTGYGKKLFRAGWKQWGLAMQDDVADATRWAIARGLGDPKRVCIAGASYGGYAALMGLIRDPGLYRCGVEWVGVSDIDLLFATNWDRDSEFARDFGLFELVGDPDKDRAQFAATSPLQLADRLHQPLLMAYGGLDERVALGHGTKMRDAVRRHNPSVEWIEYAQEGHGWWLEANRIDFWSHVERFLDKHLKNAP